MTRVQPGEDAIARIRSLCLAMPEAVEQSFGGHTAPSFRVGGKLFVMTSEDGMMMTFKAPPGVQQALIGEDAARFLAISDAVVFPHVNGGGGWNTSLHAAVCQGTFVLTTSTERSGYDPVANIYYAPPQAVDHMRQALVSYAGMRNMNPVDATESWQALAAAHITLYRSVCGVGRNLKASL